MSIKTKHLLIFAPLYPPHVGGLESHAGEWNREMSKLGHEITVFTPHIAGGPPQETVGNIKIFRYPAWEIVKNYPLPKLWHPQFWKQWQLVTSNVKCQWSNVIVVSRTRFFIPTLIALLFAKTKILPLLHIEHGSDFVQSNNPVTSLIARLYDYTFGRLTLRQADLLVANSKATAAFVKQLASREADAVIYRGIDSQKIAAIKPANLKKLMKLSTSWRARSSVIAYVGRLISGKGVSDLLQAIAKLEASEAKSYKLIIIGSGPEEANLKNQVKKLGLHNTVTFLGELPWEDTIAVMKSSDIIVNPSYTEGMPTSVIEAALCNRAVVTTDVGGTTEILSPSAACFFRPKNTAQLTAILAKLIQNPSQREQLSQKAYQEVRQKFTWEKSIGAYQTLFQQSHD